MARKDKKDTSGKDYKGWKAISEALIEALPKASQDDRVKQAGIRPVSASDILDERRLAIEAEADGIPKWVLKPVDEKLEVSQRRIDKAAPKFLLMHHEEGKTTHGERYGIAAQLRLIRRILDYSEIDIRKEPELKESITNFVVEQTRGTHKPTNFHPRKGEVPEAHRTMVREQLDKLGISEQDLSIARGQMALETLDGTVSWADREDIRAALDLARTGKGGRES